MPNLYECVNHCEKFLVDDDETHIKDILTLNNNNIVKCLRNKSETDIKHILLSLRENIISVVKEKYNTNDVKLFNSSSNNKLFGDLYCIVNDEQINIEIKFGKETNSNIGMKSFIQFMNDDIIKSYLTQSIRKEWIKQMIEENLDEEKQLLRLSNHLNQLIDEYNKKFNGVYLTTEQVDLLLNKIINSSGSITCDCNNYLKFVSIGSKFILEETITFKDNNWKFDEISHITNDNKRMVIHISNDHNEKIYLTLNWKNDYNIKNIGKVASKCGLGCPSWNVNIRRKNES